MASHSKSCLLEVVYQEPPLEVYLETEYLAEIDRIKPYRRLEGPRLIRLVMLEPGDWVSPISCRLDHRPLTDKSINYVALSYAWGSPRVTRPVLVDGIELQVTVNLESALRHLRRQSEPVFIWVDAIVSEHSIWAVFVAMDGHPSVQTACTKLPSRSPSTSAISLNGALKSASCAISTSKHPR